MKKWFWGAQICLFGTYVLCSAMDTVICTSVWIYSCDIFVYLLLMLAYAISYSQLTLKAKFSANFAYKQHRFGLQLTLVILETILGIKCVIDGLYLAYKG